MASGWVRSRTSLAYGWLMVSPALAAMRWLVRGERRRIRLQAPRPGETYVVSSQSPPGRSRSHEGGWGGFPGAPTAAPVTLTDRRESLRKWLRVREGSGTSSMCRFPHSATRFCKF